MTRPQPAPAGVGPCTGTRGAAARLGVTERTVHRWTEDGTLPVAYRTAGGHRRILVADVEALLTPTEGTDDETSLPSAD